MSATILPPSEQEMHINWCGDQPKVCYVYSDSPKWQRRLDKLGAEIVRVMSDGIGREYRLSVDQIQLRTGKRRLSDAERLRRSDRMRALRTTE